MIGIELDELTTIDELNIALANSAERPQLIFKHSLTCPISSRAFDVLQSHLKNDASSNVDYKLIIVQHSRDVSNDAARKLNVVHESPQAILVRNGQAVWNVSHFDITTASLAEAINKI
jgi:bacillithiol system protein YtxJ